MTVEQSFPSEAAVPPRRSSIAAWLRKRRWFVLVVIVPTFLAALYYGFLAPDVYVSESRFVIKSPDQKRPQLSSLASILQTSGLSSGQEQSNEILEFIRSRDALKELAKHGGIRARFAARQDIFSRFPSIFYDDSFESLYKYYTKMVDARLDTDIGTAVLKAKAFTPEDAYAINRSLLELSEGLVNRLNVRARSRAIAEAQGQVDLATQRARNARVTLAQYRNTQQVIDPAKQAVGVLEISNNLVATRASLQAQLQLMQRVAPANPSIPALRKQIDAISTQISSQDSRVVGGGRGIASKLGGYEALFVEQEFAAENLNAANAALVQARSEAQRQQFYLERIVEPNKPDMPLFPRRILNTIIVAAILTCLYLIGWMLIVGILEHAPDE